MDTRIKPSDLTAERARQVWDYDCNTGIFRWRISPSAHIPVATVAGSINKQGYRVIVFEGLHYACHRLAWLFVYGEWPNGGLDHEDTIKDHNWIGNLRPATKSQNGANMLCHRDNAAGYKGVSFHRGKWTAQIRTNGRNLHLGRHDTPEAAHAAYVAKAKELFGEFANDGF